MIVIVIVIVVVMVVMVVIVIVIVTVIVIVMVVMMVNGDCRSIDCCHRHIASRFQVLVCSLGFWV